MVHKRLTRRFTGLFNIPGRRADDDEVGLLGGPAGDSGLFGDPAQSGGILDAPDRAPTQMPGLFDRTHRPAADGAGQAGKPARRAGTGLFDKPPPRRK